MIKRLIIGSLLSLIATLGLARPYDDVSVWIIPESYSWKLKSGNRMQISVSTAMTYYSSSFEPTKAKATGRVWFYISNDTSPSLDDKFVISKPINLKDQKEKILKSKLTIDIADTGNYLLAVIDSPQDISDGASHASFAIPIVLFPL